jgi:hypothetical protein
VPQPLAPTGKLGVLVGSFPVASNATVGQKATLSVAGSYGTTGFSCQLSAKIANAKMGH